MRNCRVAISRTARVHSGTSCDRRRNSEIGGRARGGRRARKGRRTLFIRFIPRRRRDPFVHGTEAKRVSIYIFTFISLIFLGLMSGLRVVFVSHCPLYDSSHRVV